jgi:alcohol dehydrogenase class IV
VKAFEFCCRTEVLFGPGALARLSDVARRLAFRRTLLVADAGVIAAGHAGRGVSALEAAGAAVFVFDGFSTNPDSAMAEAGRAFAAPLGIDSIVGLGGGSSMDCAKAINFLLTNGGHMEDYWGWGKTSEPMLPSVGVPTTAGTGSEAQSYALISNADTHVKMACGDEKAAFRAAILDPELCATSPLAVRAQAGYDAMSHAVETAVTTKKTPASQMFSREAWRLLSGNYERVLAAPEDVEAMGGMLLGSHLAGIAIENSMLGAAHACANPLTANYGTPHGVAIAALLSHVVRWNAVAGASYDALDSDLASRLADLAGAAGLETRLAPLGVKQDDLPAMAGEAARQWTGRFNPRPFDSEGALELYRCAY